MRALAVILACSVACAGGTASTRTNPGDPVREFFELSGLEQQVSGIQPIIEEGIRQRGDVSPEFDAVYLSATREIFSAEVLRAKTLAALREQSEESRDAPLLKATLAWLRSDLGRRLVRAEEAASSADGLREMQAWAARLEAVPPLPHRVALIQRMDAITGMTERMVDQQLSMSIAMAVVFNAASTDPVPFTELVALFPEQRDGLIQPMQSLVVVTSLYAYRDVSDAELVDYLRFLESDAGVWYSEVGLSAIGRVLTERSAALAQRLASQASMTEPEASRRETARISGFRGQVLPPWPRQPLRSPNPERVA